MRIISVGTLKAFWEQPGYRDAEQPLRAWVRVVRGAAERRSGAELREALSDQLVKKYMAPENSRAGCLLITLAKPRTWAHPDTGVSLDFVGLIAMLNEHARLIADDLGGAVRVVARGLDLRPRLEPERTRPTIRTTGKRQTAKGKRTKSPAPAKRRAKHVVPDE